MSKLKLSTFLDQALPVGVLGVFCFSYETWKTFDNGAVLPGFYSNGKAAEKILAALRNI